MDETITDMYFLAPFYFSGQLIQCFDMSGNKINLKTISGWIRQKN